MRHSDVLHLSALKNSFSRSRITSNLETMRFSAWRRCKCCCTWNFPEWDASKQILFSPLSCFRLRPSLTRQRRVWGSSWPSRYCQQRRPNSRSRSTCFGHHRYNPMLTRSSEEWRLSLSSTSRLSPTLWLKSSNASAPMIWAGVL